MNKKPLLLRTIFVVGLTAIFALSMYPLTQQDFLKVFKSRLITPTINDKNIKEYYDSNYLSTIFAPLFPNESRNVLYSCSAKDLLSPSIVERFEFKDYHSNNTDWKEILK